MRKTQKNKRSKNKKLKKKGLSVKRTSLNLVKKRWIVRRKTFSPYPYILTISYYKTNVFFTIADIEGRTKGWSSTGRFGFKKKDKTAYMAIVKVTEQFMKKIWSLGIRRVLLKFKNVYKRDTRFAIRNSLRKNWQSYPFKYLGILFQMQIAFNGCRKKKQRRR